VSQRKIAKFAQKAKYSSLKTCKQCDLLTEQRLLCCLFTKHSKKNFVAFDFSKNVPRSRQPPP